MWHLFALFRGLSSRFLALLCLQIERLRHHGRSAPVAEQQDRNLEIARVVLDVQHISNAHFARGFRWLPVALNPAEFTGSAGNRPRLKKPGGPKPFIDPHAVHHLILVRSSPKGMRKYRVSQITTEPVIGAAGSNATSSSNNSARTGAPRSLPDSPPSSLWRTSSS